MGYHVTIIRTKDAMTVPISLEEVQSSIISLGGWKYIKENDSFVKENGTEESCVLWYDKGELWTKNPSEWALEQMLALASLLKARVRGDELETYETLEKSYTHPDDIILKKRAEIEGEALLRKLKKEDKLMHAAIIGFFILLAVIVFFVGKSFEK